MLSWRSHSSCAHCISGCSASSASFCPAAVSAAALESHLGAPVRDFSAGSRQCSKPLAHTIESGNARGLKTGQHYSNETSTFIHALLHNQSVLSWKLDRDPIGCVGLKKVDQLFLVNHWASPVSWLLTCMEEMLPTQQARSYF